MALSFLNIDVQKTGEVSARIDAGVQKGIDSGLESILRTLQQRIRKATPVGIRYKSYGKTKKGKSKTKKAGFVWTTGPNAGRQATYKGRWVVSGELKASWQFDHTRPSEIRAFSTVRHGAILEAGKYKGIGKPRLGLMSGGLGQVAPRTVQAEGGIYSSRAVGGILAPIAKDQAFLQGSVELILKGIRKELRNISREGKR